MGFTQWSTPDGEAFFPAGQVVKRLPPDYYKIQQTMNGIFFLKNPIKTEELVAFPDSASDKVINEIQRFWKLENKFREAQIPFKRGILMYGPPGSGKTCALRTVVEDLTKNQNGIVVDFCSPSLLKEGYELVRKIHPDIPIIVMIEDLDAVLYRHNESEVLNLLDGMYGIDKTVFVATTNYPEKLGSRIMNRPSRFDKRIFIGMPTEAARQVYLNAKLKNLEESHKWAKDTDGFSIAHLKELFVAVKILGEGYIDALRTLQTMKDGPTSQSFDPYNTKTEYSCEVTPGPAYCESKGTGSKGMINEDKYAQYGTGKLYKKMKEQMKSGIQKRTPNVSDIARIISEDIRHDNGFIK